MNDRIERSEIVFQCKFGRKGFRRQHSGQFVPNDIIDVLKERLDRRPCTDALQQLAVEVLELLRDEFRNWFVRAA